jgi:hypothetical protein
VLDAYKRKVFDPLNLSIERIWAYPERGSNESRFLPSLIASAIRLILSGDTLCLLLRKRLPRTN